MYKDTIVFDYAMESINDDMRKSARKYDSAFTYLIGQYNAMLQTERYAEAADTMDQIEKVAIKWRAELLAAEPDNQIVLRQMGTVLAGLLACAILIGTPAATAKINNFLNAHVKIPAWLQYGAMGVATSALVSTPSWRNVHKATNAMMTDIRTEKSEKYKDNPNMKSPAFRKMIAILDGWIQAAPVFKAELNMRANKS